MQNNEINAKQELIERLQAELAKAKTESDQYLNAIMEQKCKQAEEMDQIQTMHNDLVNAKASLAIEKERFEKQQVEYEAMQVKLNALEE